jgi:hypothetical protein
MSSLGPQINIFAGYGWTHPLDAAAQSSAFLTGFALGDFVSSAQFIHGSQLKARGLNTGRRGIKI